MAKGRIFSRVLDQDIEHFELDDSTAMKLLRMHLYADDEGYITTKKAKEQCNLTKKAESELISKNFIEKDEKAKLFKILEWKKFQKIPFSKFSESNLKEYWTNPKNRDDALISNGKEESKK